MSDSLYVRSRDEAMPVVVELRQRLVPGADGSTLLDSVDITGDQPGAALDAP